MSRLKKIVLAILSVPLLLAAASSDTTASQAPPSLTLGPLFGRVALAEIFADGKSWADAQPIRSPEVIRREFEAAPPATDAELRAFVESRFIAPPEVATTQQPPQGLSLRAHIAALWPILTRESRDVPDHSSLLSLPNRYVVPGGRFREIYYWDSYFTMLGMGPEQAQLKRDMVGNFASMIRRFGHIPNGNRTYYLSRSQPPFFFKMVELLDPAHPGRAEARNLAELRQEYEWWMRGSGQARPGFPVLRVVRMRDGELLNRYWDDRAAPRDESYAADVKVAAMTPDPRGTYRNIRAAAESGWDFSSRWFADGKSLATIRTVDIVPPDLNSLLYGLESAIARGCAEVRDRVCASTMRAEADARSRAIRKYLWNSNNGIFDDYNWRTRRPVGNISAAALYPLYMNIATRAQASSTATVVARELVKQGGLVTTNRETGQQWDAPNGWAPLQWIAVRGLRNYGQDALAKTVARRWVATVSRVYESKGKLLEKYDVVTRRPGGGGEYALQDGFGWTNGVTEALIRDYPDLEPSRSKQIRHSVYDGL